MNLENVNVIKHGRAATYLSIRKNAAIIHG